MSGGTSRTTSETADTSGSANPRGTANATGSTAISTSISVTSERRTEITRAFCSVTVEPITDVNVTVNVGTVVPETAVTHPHACPNEVVRILKGLPECRYVILRNQMVIGEPKTR